MQTIGQETLENLRSRFWNWKRGSRICLRERGGFLLNLTKDLFAPFKTILSLLGIARFLLAWLEGVLDYHRISNFVYKIMAVRRGIFWILKNTHLLILILSRFIGNNKLSSSLTRRYPWLSSDHEFCLRNKKKEEDFLNPGKYWFATTWPFKIYKE